MVEGLTERDGLVDPEAAEDPIHVAGVSEAISRHNHLKGFWKSKGGGEPVIPKHLQNGILFLLPLHLPVVVLNKSNAI